MVRNAVIENGTVANIIVGYVAGLTLVPDDGTAQIGGTWDGTRFHPATIPAPTVAQYEAAVQSMLDAKAHAFSYDNIASACTYAGDADSVFNDQGTKLKAWRSACWRACYTELAAVQGGAPQPSIDQLLAMLPPSPL
jgi:hypothetical protein